LGITNTLNLYKMKKQYLIALAFAGILALTSSCHFGAKYKALIVTGQNNHNWKASSPILKQLLEETELFSTDIATSPDNKGDMSTFTPNFSKYDVVVLDYNGAAWPEATQKAFEKYVSNGGGVVSFHAADNSFPEWKEYNKMIGLGGWGGRTEKSGPYLYYVGDKMVLDTAAGRGGSHGKNQEFEIRMRNIDHPIINGLPKRWIHGSDELYNQLRGPAENLEVLATAFSAKNSGGSGRVEPILMTIKYGKGRIFHSTLGHTSATGGPALECAGFIVTFQRGAEWVASGNVTQKVPYDFPNAGSSSLRAGFKQLTLEDDLDKIASYDITKSTKYFVDLQSRIRAEGKTPEAMQGFEKKMIGVLQKPEATPEGKRLLIHELSWMGSELSVPVIQELAKNPALKDEAEFAIARLKPTK
jgi:type 1 glutamine amidotransferase